MRVLITGAAGFVGQLLATSLLNDEKGLYTVLLTDIVEPPIPRGVRWPEKCKSITADLCSESERVVDKDMDAVFVLHGIMSSGAEANFELGLRVNFDATRALLDMIRTKSPGARVIYSSSGAVYNTQVQLPVDESMRAIPETSYGAEKMMCEYLINDFTRRGFINGLILRFPTVSVRPGVPTAAASSFLSGMIREPMNGEQCVIPIQDRGWRHWLCSPRILAKNLVLSLTLPRDALPPHDRVVNHPGIGVSIQDMMDSLARVAGADKLALLHEKDDPEIRPILYSWATQYDNSKALALGFKRDTSFDDIVRDYKAGLEMSKK